MARITNLLLADSIREEKTGKFTIVGVYLDVVLEEQPSPADVYVLVIADKLDVGKHELSLRLVDRSAKRAAVGPSVEMIVKEKNEKFVNIIQIPNITFPSRGIYSLIAEIDGERLGRHDFNISFPISEGNEFNSTDN